ncbi:MAG: DegT/DnrJ/EryC1/StrS family aminotransferase [Ignavibacteriales bacterium]|nr:DegT/DnrJ/EryC1/StrS family aminotransferase [Ignavibacteriales bacterium]
MITKKPENVTNFRMNCCFFKSARKAFSHVLNNHLSCVLLAPAYIGFSSREGSGIFDPIRESRIKYCFYKMNKDLYIDMVDLKNRLIENEKGILLLIHYFGFRDPNYSEAKELAIKMNYIVVEDCAHALFTFLFGADRNFDYAFFSLHKMLPYRNGGMLLSKYPQESETIESFNLHEYDCYQIAQRRCENYQKLKELMEPLCARFHIHLLRDALEDAVPQSFPILLPDANSRDRLYFGLNEVGYGVVSLYHELIPEIDRYYSESHFLSTRILNLPVHQDVRIDELELMVRNLKQLL